MPPALICAGESGTLPESARPGSVAGELVAGQARPRRTNSPGIYGSVRTDMDGPAAGVQAQRGAALADAALQAGMRNGAHNFHGQVG